MKPDGSALVPLGVTEGVSAMEVTGLQVVQSGFRKTPSDLARCPGEIVPSRDSGRILSVF